MPTLFPPELVSTSQKALNERLAFLTVLSKKPTMSERNLTAQMTRQPSVSGAGTAKCKLVLTPTEGEDNTVHQVASAADSIGNSIRLVQPDTPPPWGQVRRKMGEAACNWKQWWSGWKVPTESHQESHTEELHASTAL